MELVTGATGYIGGRLLRRLIADGREVRVLARNPAALERQPVDVVQGDVIIGNGLRRALEGCETAYYLVHSMERAAGPNGAFADLDRRAAENFAHAAQEAGVDRVVYLGGLVPQGGAISPHLRSRLEVEGILLDAIPGSVALRASIVIGARSSSFQLLVRLIERLRVLPMPAWRGNRTQPIDERDAIEYLARAPITPAAAGRSLDIAGPDVLTYGQMIERIAEAMGVGRVPVGLGFSLTPPAAAVVASVTGLDVELVRPLMESLEYDLLPRNMDAVEIFGHRPRRFERAVEHALAEWETIQPLAAR
ncbi:MAG TPA: NAD(P)H-binding protein [Thermoleophilaceae bacterium]|nr:NAD(P)H-binding protein [Thermoleophilaceae bacterium]